MDLVSDIRDGTMTIRLDEPRLDAAIAIQFKDRARELPEGAPPSVVLDLASVTFLDSSGLGAIVAAMKAVGPDRRFMLSGVTPNVGRVLRLTRMDTVLAILPDLDLPEVTVDDGPPTSARRNGTV